jgi:Domain of unknown function (DUF4062)
MASEKRYQVFVSSTYFDLIIERQAVTAALLQLDAFPSGMELFPAADDDAWTLIKRVIDDCDYYLLVVAGMYGSIDDSDGLSYTEKEYDYAVSAGKPVMAFLHGDVDTIPSGMTEKDSETRKKLEEFRTKVKRAKHVKFWTSPDQLAGQVALSFSQFTKQYPAIGWVRADQLTSPETLAELNSLRKQLATLEAEFDEISLAPPPGTSELAQGDDHVTLNIHLSGHPDIKGSGGQYQPMIQKWDTVSPSWSEIIAAIGPRLLDECEEGSLQALFDSWINAQWLIHKWNAALLDQMNKGRKSKLTLERVTFSKRKAEVESDGFRTIIVQLLALGIIKRSDKKHSISDRQTYWSLTQYGRRQLIQLRALRRPSPGDTEPTTTSS